MYLFMILAFVPLTLAYRAAVLEYHPIIADTPRNTILWNLHEYRYYASKAKERDADIIIFPEYGLTGLVVNNTKSWAVEVHEFSEPIIYLKSIAEEYQIYVVVNLLEKAHSLCCDFPVHHSTTLVIDRTGSVVARYRKIHLFNEVELTPGDWNQNALFHADFNVTFGILVSHDILFNYPSKNIVDEGVKDVVCPSAWSSTIPFYFSLSVHHGYSLSNSLTLLVSGFNQPWKSFSGTGIYTSDGGIKEALYTDSAKSKLIVQEIVTDQIKTNAGCSEQKEVRTQPTRANYAPQKDFYPSLYSYKTANVNLTQGNISQQICDGEFCCTFQINITSSTNTSFYKLVAYNGYMVYDRRQLHVETCSLVSCENDLVDSCGSTLNASTNFTRISVWGNFTTKIMVYLPLALDFDLFPLDSVYCQHTDTNYLSAQLKTTNQENILVFGILGQTESASLKAGSLLLYLLIFLLRLL